MLEAIAEYLRGEGLLLTFSRLAIIGGWIFALHRIWEHRHRTHANQALAGALAMVLAEALLVLGVDAPHDVIVFFIALAQLTIAISLSRILAASRSEPPPESTEHAPIPMGGLYLRSMIVVAALGVIFSALQSWLLAN